MARPRLIADITPLRRSRQFRILWFGELVSLLGTQLTVVAVPYQTYQITHSTLYVGLVSLGQLLPLLAGSLVGGSIADAHDRRKVLLLAQVLLALTSAGLALNASTSHPALWPIFVLTAIGAGFSGLDTPTRTAVLANVIDRELFASAAALWQLLFQTAGVAGPALAGLVIAGVGVRSAYWIDVATFAVAFVAVAMLKPLPPVGGARRAGLRSILEGFAYLKGRQELQGSFVIDLNAMIFGLPRAVFPELTATRFHGGAVVLGLLYAAPGAGALVASVLAGWVGTVRRQGLAIVVSVSVWGLAIVLFGIAHVLVLALALLAVAGAADVISAVFRSTILQTLAPDELRGRLSSIHNAVVTGGPRLGDIETGVVTALTGPEFAVVSGGLACIVGVVLIALKMPRFANYETPVATT